MSELNDMTCAELADVAAELALGVLTGRERAVAIAHLDTCDACREHVRQLMATGEQLRGLLPVAEPPAGFETRVLERLALPVPARQEAAQDDDEEEARPRQARRQRRAARTRHGTGGRAGTRSVPVPDSPARPRPGPTAPGLTAPGPTAQGPAETGDAVPAGCAGCSPPRRWASPSSWPALAAGGSVSRPLRRRRRPGR